MTQQKAVVGRYTDGFRKGDLAPILTCLTDDVVWALHGAKTLVGKGAWQRLAVGLVSRLDTFHIWLGEVLA